MFLILPRRDSKTGSLDEGKRIGELAIALYERFSAKAYYARLSMFYYVGVHVWTQPYLQALEPLANAYRIGLETGDVEYASICFNVYWTLRVPIVHLRDLDNEMLDFSKRMESHRQKIGLLVSKPFWQAIRNLMGLEDHPEDLSGSIFDSKQIEAARKTGGIFFGIICFPRMMLSFLWGDYDSAVGFAHETRALTRNHFSPFMPSMVLLFDALSAVGQARKLGLRSARRANKIATNLRRLASNAPQNYLVMYNIIAAEIGALRGDHATAFPCYITAISMSRDEGSLLYNSLANELCGKYFLGRKDRETAEVYLRDAICTYNTWGAISKAQHLADEMQTNGFKSLQGIL